MQTPLGAGSRCKDRKLFRIEQISSDFFCFFPPFAYILLEKKQEKCKFVYFHSVKALFCLVDAPLALLFRVYFLEQKYALYEGYKNK